MMANPFKFSGAALPSYDEINRDLNVTGHTELQHGKSSGMQRTR